MNSYSIYEHIRNGKERIIKLIKEDYFDVEKTDSLFFRTQYYHVNLYNEQGSISSCSSIPENHNCLITPIDEPNKRIDLFNNVIVVNKLAIMILEFEYTEEIHFQLSAMSYIEDAKYEDILALIEIAKYLTPATEAIKTATYNEIFNGTFKR